MLGGTKLLGDANGDGLVSFADYQIVAGHWLQRGVNVLGDLNGDGVVNFGDMQLLLTNWGKTVSTGSFNTVPEPNTGLLLGLAGIGIWRLSSARRRKALAS